MNPTDLSNFTGFWGFGVLGCYGMKWVGMFLNAMMSMDGMAC